MSKSTRIAGIIMVLSVAIALVGCGLGKGDQVVKKYEDLAKKGCECKDAECAKGALNEFKTISIENKNVVGNDKQMKAVGDASMKFMNCMKDKVSPQDLLQFASDLQKLGK